MATLYRDSWTSGNASVNFDSFFLVANEKSFFLKTVRFLGFNVAPLLNAYEDFNEDDKYHKKLDYIFRCWKKRENFFIEVKKLMHETGNEYLLKRY
jgi:hypothetical protein